MVSQAEPSQISSHVLTRHGSSSVVSRSSRRHRHNRSVAGGTSYIPQNDFPIFSSTGDVEIIITAGNQTNRYLLHRIYLAQCSGFFEASTSQEWSRATITTSYDDSAGGGGRGSKELARIGEEDGGSRVSSRARSREGGTGGTESQVGVGRRKWRYELDYGTGNDDIPMLVQKDSSNTTSSLFGSSDSRPPPVRNKPPASNASFFRSVANLSVTPSHAESGSRCTPEELELLNDYDNLFRVFYNYAPALDSIDIATAYLQCKSLLTLADQYDALPVVGPRIDHHLLQFQSRLWKQIAKYPSSYLKIGYLAQSKSIFQEALIHVVGAWPVGERHIRSQLPESVLEVIEDKIEDLEDLVGKIERKLFKLTLCTPRGERVTPQNSYLDWLVVSFFRQWVVEQTSPAPIPPPPSTRTLSSRDSHHRPQHSSRHHHTLTSPTSLNISQSNQVSQPQNNQGLFYRLLGGPPINYLTHDDCKRFLKLSPEFYSREGLKRFEKRLDEVKGLARETVKPLMMSQLEGMADGVSYLVCTRVEERDWPWM